MPPTSRPLKGEQSEKPSCSRKRKTPLREDQTSKGKLKDKKKKFRKKQADDSAIVTHSTQNEEECYTEADAAPGACFSPEMDSNFNIHTSQPGSLPNITSPVEVGVLPKVTSSLAGTVSSAEGTSTVTANTLPTHDSPRGADIFLTDFFETDADAYPAAYSPLDLDVLPTVSPLFDAHILRRVNSSLEANDLSTHSSSPEADNLSTHSFSPEVDDLSTHCSLPESDDSSTHSFSTDADDLPTCSSSLKPHTLPTCSSSLKPHTLPTQSSSLKIGTLPTCSSALKGDTLPTCSYSLELDASPSVNSLKESAASLEYCSNRLSYFPFHLPQTPVLKGRAKRNPIPENKCSKVAANSSPSASSSCQNNKVPYSTVTTGSHRAHSRDVVVTQSNHVRRIQGMQSSAEVCSTPPTFRHSQYHQAVPAAETGSFKKINVNCNLQNAVMRSKLSRAFKFKFSHRSDDGKVHLKCRPFPHCVVSSFIRSERFLHELKEELSKLEFTKRRSDLYRFKQSDDLASASSPHISTFRKILYEECLPWMREITHLPLTNQVDMSCSIYSNTDVLLCHDDRLEGRRIAFIYYLVPEWNKSDGGALQLFNSERDSPTNIARSIYPEWNRLVFFEVSSKSFHQVQEVLSGKLRLSISGWYHAPTPTLPRDIIPEPHVRCSPSSSQDELLAWINRKYLHVSMQRKVKRHFIKNSEIQLVHFLSADKYSKILDALVNTKVSDWKVVGPPNKRHYKELQIYPAIVAEFLRVFTSEEMLVILSQLTNLNLSEVGACDYSKTERCSSPSSSSSSSSSYVMRRGSCTSPALQQRCSVRLWKHGDYTLLHDGNDTDFWLDATLFFVPLGWRSCLGGYTSYVAEDDGMPLLKVEPTADCLALVYKDDQTAQFVKYINSRARCFYFYDINMKCFE